MSTTERSITVTGEGKIAVKPDTASLNLGVSVTAATATEALSRANAAAKAAGDNLAVGGVSFYVDDTEPLLGAARADAVHNARKRAGEYATAAGTSVGAVIQISELTSGGLVQPMFRAASISNFGGGGVPTPIEAGMQALEVSVTVVYELS